MKAYDIAGKRAAAGIGQLAFAERMNWNVATLRDVEQGRVDITEAENARLNSTLSTMSTEKTQPQQSEEKEEVLA